MEKEIDYLKIPYQYLLCLNRQCTNATTCLRQIAGRNLPDSTVFCNVLNPGHLSTLKSDCPYYRSNKKVRYAKGFLGMLENIPYKLIPQVTNNLIDHFNRRTYYRVRKGERLLSPSEQKDILEILIKWGVTQPQEFDAYYEEYDW